MTRNSMTTWLLLPTVKIALELPLLFAGMPHEYSVISASFLVRNAWMTSSRIVISLMRIKRW